ncbi:MAG: hypothetical protein A3I11_07485 [Elusimicrobia bacterium RIFCSPLOWO2_02_FULL_39_32]|nr:MAG: hypothetical protein A2034_00050 [Elusimicrobia bacterium GWA2_38_7]OGR81406.1 MAG: hypothetical protein A3B80_05140 [Elusimicrobia bacterium RIFCSPHIGHO2_02_FULL_39_36]OGR92027.1 MAG: hypothetical protein A3I11_07485 [Elusimicrobia bacterium RIFCSPLOWO2_02_FULL_39_32]OGR98682.1 MAG: hypothetical protein A3G85_04945 [Elusimicrobia bacterium RIFCSPLOWO2_12_FULL_39_28]OGZ59776.1 MAG: hypothetical protein A3E58_00215 [Candidatus Spechtbacteria bacterium RIFCSPHIGHO2_12_FULL_38_30]
MNRFFKLNKIILSCATGFGLGNLAFSCSGGVLKKFPALPQKWSGGGFLGTLLGFGFVFLGFPLTGLFGFLTLFLVTCLSTFIADRAEKIFEKKDDSKIVIDEIIGAFWSVAFFPLDQFRGFNLFIFIASAFILFRIFDVFKIPFKSVQNWKGGLGVMADDLLAGFSVNLLLRIVLAVR